MKRAHKKKKKTWLKIVSRNEFNLFQHHQTLTLWEVSYKHFEKEGKYLRKRFNAEGLESALEIAKQKAGLVGKQDSKKWSILECTDLAFKNSNRSSSKDWDYSVEKFLKWLKVNHSEIAFWGQLTPDLFLEYKSEFVNLADNTTRLVLQPLKQTAQFMEEFHGLPNVAKGVKTGTQNKRKTPKVALKDVLCLLDWLSENNPELEAGAALQGLAGLRLTECWRIPWVKVDLNHALVEVSGELKNIHSERVIPVSKRVIEALTREKNRQGKIARLKFGYRDGFVVWFARWKTYSENLSEAIREWNAEIGWQPKDLRNCILQHFRRKVGVTSILDEYVGHAAKTITEKNYLDRLNCATNSEQEALGERMAEYYLHVVKPFDESIKAIESGQNQCEILNYFELRKTSGTDKQEVVGS